MPNVWMKDGALIQFMEHGRPGGSFHNIVEYKDAFVVITDEWGKVTAIPAADVKKVEQKAYRSW